jgi:uncharacterized protein (DUF2062 family)
MIRKVFKKTSKHEKFKILIKKYKIPKRYIATNRKMVSKAILIGVFIAFIPMPMQMLAVLGLMPFFKFNVPIALSMCWLSNPFTMPFMYYMEYLTGSFILGSTIEPVEMTLDWFSENLEDIFIPMYFGALFYSIFGSLSASILVNYFWKISVEKEKKLHYKQR